MDMPLLQVKDLVISTKQQKQLVKGISFEIKPGEWFAIIGESGSGKSLTAFSLAKLLPSGLQVTSNHVLFDQQNIANLKDEPMRCLRGKKIAYVFQDYQTSFTPYRRIGQQMEEVLQAHTHLTVKEQKIKVTKALQEVGLNGEAIYSRYPFQLSGGQLQRASLAQAMLLEPQLLIADEPTTALDAVSTKHVLDLIYELKQQKKCAVLFISHDLRTVRRYADRIAIMRQGNLIEQGDKEQIINNPEQAYTRDLLASIPPLINPPERLPIFNASYQGE